MPYIVQERRVALDGAILGLAGYENVKIETTGELNYLLTLVVRKYLDTHGLKYATLNDVVGALDGAKAEFQRRVVAPYEDTKIKENGDVY